MAAQGLTAADLAALRANLEAQRDLAKAVAAGYVPANMVCNREFNSGQETAFNYALNALDDLLADAITFTVVDPGESESA